MRKEDIKMNTMVTISGYKNYFDFSESSLRSACIIMIVIWIVLQLFFVGLYAGLPQYSDAGEYYRLALQCYENDAWYPMMSHIHNEPFIFNPGYVNFLVLQLKVLGSLKYYPFINILLNIVLLYSIFKLTSNLFGKRIGYTIIIMFCLLVSNYTSVVATMTELLTTSFIFVALLLCRKSYWSLLLSAGLLVLAHYIRPSSLLFVPSILFYFIYKHYGYKKMSFFLASIIVLFISLTSLVRMSTGAARMSGTTGGYNLLMVANDDVTGDFLPEIYGEGGCGYLGESHYTVYQKDSVWMNRSITWIANNPIKYLSYFPHKLIGLWKTDLDYTGLFQDKTVDFKGEDNFLFIVKKVCRFLTYYIILFLSFIGLWRVRKKIWGYYGIILLPLLLNCGMIMVVYGYARYHYIFMPIVLLFATFSLINPEVELLKEKK